MQRVPFALRYTPLPAALLVCAVTSVPGLVTLANNKWTQVVWEIEPLARDRVTAIKIGYWVNKMLAASASSGVWIGDPSSEYAGNV